MPSNMTSRAALDFINARAARRSAEAAQKFNGPDWGKRHLAAWNTAVNRTDANHVGDMGKWAIVNMLVASANYADQHRARYASAIGEDYVLGIGFANILQGIRTLLNGECGNLDCGTLDAMVLDLASGNAINPETFELGYSSSAEER